MRLPHVFHHDCHHERLCSKMLVSINKLMLAHCAVSSDLHFIKMVIISPTSSSTALFLVEEASEKKQVGMSSKNNLRKNILEKDDENG